MKMEGVGQRKDPEPAKKKLSEEEIERLVKERWKLKKKIIYMVNRAELALKSPDYGIYDKHMKGLRAIFERAHEPNATIEDIHTAYDLWEQLEKPGGFYKSVLAASALLGSNKHYHQMAKKMIEGFLENNNLPYSKLYKAWTSNASRKIDDEITKKSSKDKEKEKELHEDELGHFNAVVAMNLMCISMLERDNKGITRFLYDNYGVRNFGRFTQETWEAQFKSHEKKIPYVLVVSARNDWNSTTYDSAVRNTYDELGAKLEPTHQMVIIEAGSLPELAHLLVKVQKSRGQTPTAVVWSGHGDSKSFFLGPSRHRPQNYKYEINYEDFRGEATERISKYLKMFSPETTMIIDACSDQDESMLAQTVAEQIGNKIIYPKGQTQVKNFGVNKNEDGSLSFDVKYYYGVKALTTDGQKQS